MKDTIPAVEFALDEDCEYTPSAFLVAVLQWAHEHGVWPPFARWVDSDMKTVVYSPTPKLPTLIASIILGCPYNHAINHRLVPDEVAAAVSGLAAFLIRARATCCCGAWMRATCANSKPFRPNTWRVIPGTPPPPRKRAMCLWILTNVGKTYELSRKGYFPGGVVSSGRA